MFEVGLKVITPKGLGYVTYTEDDYIEVEVKGNEYSFESPFTGIKDFALAEAAELADEQRDKEAEEKLNLMCLEDTNPLILLTAQLLHERAALTIEMLGGSASMWEELTATQKMNFVRMVK